MTNRKTIAIGALLVLIVLGATTLHLHKVKSEQKAYPPCTVTACIRIDQANGPSYELNDFRFLPNNCILILSLPDNTSRKICGNYNLVWIGPSNTAIPPKV